MKYNLLKIFEPKTHLHLIIWDRLNKIEHKKAMHFFTQLSDTMPMLRPIGRQKTSYEYYRIRFDSVLKKQIPSIETYQTRTSHCELWLQVPHKINGKIKQKLSLFFSDLSSSIVFFEQTNPIWEPIGSDFSNCMYANATNGAGTKVLCDLGETKSAYFLKLIWFIGTQKVLNWHTKNKPLNLKIENVKLYSLMEDIFSEIDLSHYNIAKKSTVCAPWTFGAAHLAAFAVNAITQPVIKPVYLVEEYFDNNKLTRPYQFRTKEEFLAQYQIKGKI